MHPELKKSFRAGADLNDLAAQEAWLMANTFRCESLKANITVAQCEAMRKRPENGSVDGKTQARPPYCATCTAWQSKPRPKVKTTKEDSDMGSRKDRCKCCGRYQTICARGMCSTCYAGFGLGDVVELEDGYAWDERDKLPACIQDECPDIVCLDEVPGPDAVLGDDEPDGSYDCDHEGYEPERKPARPPKTFDLTKAPGLTIVHQDGRVEKPFDPPAELPPTPDEFLEQLQAMPATIADYKILDGTKGNDGPGHFFTASDLNLGHILKGFTTYSNEQPPIARMDRQAIYVNPPAVREYRMDRFTHFRLHFNKTTRAVAIEGLDSKDEPGSLKLIIDDKNRHRIHASGFRKAMGLENIPSGTWPLRKVHDRVFVFDLGEAS